MLYVGTWYELIALPVMTRIEVSHFLHRRAPHRTVLDIRAPEKSPESERVPRREVSQRESTNSSHFFRRLCELLTGWVCDPNRGATAPGRGYFAGILSAERRTHRSPSGLARVLPRTISLGCRTSFCTRQFSNSATKSTFSDGHAIS